MSLSTATLTNRVLQALDRPDCVEIRLLVHRELNVGKIIEMRAVTFDLVSWPEPFDADELHSLIDALWTTATGHAAPRDRAQQIVVPQVKFGFPSDPPADFIFIVRNSPSAGEQTLQLGRSIPHDSPLPLDCPWPDPSTAAGQAFRDSVLNNTNIIQLSDPEEPPLD